MLSSFERRILRSVAEAVVPAGKFFDGGGDKDVEKLERFLSENKRFAAVYKRALQLLEFSTVVYPPFKKFSQLSRDDREKILSKWRNGNLTQIIIADILCETVKTAHFSDEDVYSRIGCVWDKSPKNVSLPRFVSQIKSSADMSNNESIECDVVVVGSGAGGAVVAKELAEKGLAVLIIEEGKYYSRKDFTGKFVESTRRFYRDKGYTFAFGNTVIPVPMGRMVGGSTAINTGTCWRTPKWVLDKWVRELGLAELSYEKLEPYFERVESILQVEKTKDKVIGGIAKVIARGCDELGYRHFPVNRNAPECEGQGVCNFGCPTDARLSTNVSYIPMALQSGALLLEETKAKKVIVKDGRAVGIEAESVTNKNRVLIKSKIVVLSCGSVMTPVLLLSQNICNSSGQVGKNLTIHPCVNVCALFEDDVISSYKYALQGYCVDSFHRYGVLLLHAGLPIDAGASVINFVGKKFSEVVSNFDHIASFGAMVEDTPSGRVFIRNGKPLIFYWVKERELSLLKFGIEVLARIFLSAGAKEVYPLVRGFDVISSWSDLDRFRRKKFSVLNYRIACFHPLGTCRMGIDPKRSVVSQSHETHDIKNLYICDGSVIPTSIAVNPQETIMTLSTRASFEILKKFE